ncbi:MAG: hypothetical protein KAV68_04105 [Dehalococcoidales bacterium]|nr:hypothetical protein [Dehalococcoidales bacterium]
MQLLAGVALGLDYLLSRSRLKKINRRLSKALSWSSSKPGRARKISLLAALSIAGLAIALPMAIYGEADISSWEGIVGTIMGVIFLTSFGGVAYTQLLDFIAKKARQRHVLRHKGEKLANDRDVLIANSFLFLITTLLGIILPLILYYLAKTFPFIALALIFVYMFLLPAFVGSLCYLLIRGSIALLDKIGKMPKGALGPLALGLFVFGGIIILIEVW